MERPSWQDQLRSSGHRITPQRRAILAAVAELRHPTPESIHQHLTPGDPDLSLSTVYRNLAVLQEAGLVTHAHIGSGSPVYHLADAADHIHLSCLACGVVVSVPVAAAGEFTAAIDRLTGFLPEPTHSAIYGLCADCRGVHKAGSS